MHRDLELTLMILQPVSKQIIIYPVYRTYHYEPFTFSTDKAHLFIGADLAYATHLKSGLPISLKILFNISISVSESFVLPSAVL